VQILGRWGRRHHGPLDKGIWCSYNFAAGSFHTKKLCSRLLSTEVKFYSQKQQNRVLCHPLGDLGVTYTIHLWLVVKRVVGFLLVLIEHFFASYHGWGAMSGYWSKWLCSKGGGSLWAQISGRKGGRTPTIVGVRKLESLGYHVALFAWSYV